ncbi:MAG: hypothetical protein HY461_01010 [Parcubacteria group bacterium]|nr:hypothetical protein [Parcubacteria group bacterium]
MKRMTNVLHGLGLEQQVTMHYMGKTLHKSLTVAVSAMTALWSVGIAAFAPLAAAAAPSAAVVSEGDLVKASLAAVYYIGDNGKRYVFPNEKTYKTWWSNFSAVDTITDAQLAAIAIGGNVTYRPGARLVKITTDPKVYLVGGNGELHPINSEATALDLFGSSWAQKIDDVSDAFFTNYTVSSETIATGLGLGGLPVGTLVSYLGDNYLVGADDVWLVNGDVSIYRSVAMPSSASEFEAWTGLAVDDVTEEVDAADIVGLVTPDRAGSFDDGSAPTPTPTPSGLTIESKTTATNLAMASGSSQSAGKSVIEVCSDSALTVTGFKVTSVNGTVGFSTVIAWFQDVTSGSLYEVTGTSNGDSVAEFESTDGDVSVNGCREFAFYAATSSTGGILNLRLTEMSYTSTGAAAVFSAGNLTLQNRNVVPVATADLMDLTLGADTAPATLQTDGTKQQIFTVQVTVANNDAYIPNVVFKLNGSIMVSSCEFRISGIMASTNYKWVGGKYIVFELPEAKRVQIEATKTWEIWCNVDGEAGQTVTPQLVWPAPFFWFQDNIRVSSDGKEIVAPTITRLSATADAAINLAGASMTIEAVNLNNVKNSSGVQLDDEVTSGSTNSVLAIYKVKVRGSKATLSSLLNDITGTDAAAGLTACQIKIGQRNDKGGITVSSINLADYSLSNYGGENNMDDDPQVTVTASKQLAVGDWLFLVECDFTATAGPYTTGRTVIHNFIDPNNSNVTFDIGTSVDFPAANTAGSTVTIRLLSALAVASNASVRYIVSNATNVILGEYTITGPSQEGVNVTSVGVLFEGSDVAGAGDANITGSDGCTTVTLQDAAGTELSTSQSLTDTNADVTLTFPTTFSVAANAQFKLRPVCVQASSDLTTPAGTVTNATVLATIAGTGLSSSQSFSNAPATLGANVVKLGSGTMTANVGQLQSAQIIGPSETLKVHTMQTAASIHEDQYLNRVRVTLTPANGATATDISTIVVKAEGFTISGTAAAAETTICTRTVTSIVVTDPSTIDCQFNDGFAMLGAGQTGLLTVYAIGNTLGGIGSDTTPTNSIITPSIDLDTDTDSQIIFKGAESQALINNSADPAVTNGRVVTPAGATVRVVSKSLPSTFVPGQADMVLGKMDLIVGGTSITVTEISARCTTNDAANVCLDGTDTLDLALDNTVIANDLAFVGASPSVADGAAATDTLVTTGTHSIEWRLTDINCGTGDTAQLATTEFGFTVAGVPGVTQSFASAGVLGFPVTVLPDFNTFGGNLMSHQANQCGA